MKNLFFALTLFITCSSLSIAQDWINYKSEELAFIAEFPETPKKSVQEVQTSVGLIDMHMVMSTPVNDDNGVYSVIKSDYPKSFFDNATEESNSKVLDGAVQGAVNNVNGKLLYSNKITFNGFPGRESKIEITGAYLYLNSYLVNNQMYINQVICYADNDNNASIKRFFDSFDIIKVKE